MLSKITQEDLLKMKHHEVIELVKEYLKGLPNNDIRYDFIHNINVCVYCGSTDLPCYCHRTYDI